MALPKCYARVLVGLAGVTFLTFGANTAPGQILLSPQKPLWLTDLSLGVKESYDDNVLLVADKNPGLPAQSSWVTTVSPKVGFDFTPFFGPQTILQSLTLAYSPDFAIYHDAPEESYDAHRILNTLKLKAGDFSFSLDNAFLFNDGTSQGPIYALNQTGPSLDQADKYASAYASATARERRKQIQDRTTVVLQYDLGRFFIRPKASLLLYDLMTDWHKNTVAPYIGYQNYEDRADMYGGADLGYQATKNLAVTLGYFYGHQYQQAFPAAVAPTYQSSSDYQRILLGLEGKPWNWLNVKISGGPDFRAYNDTAPVNDLHPVTYYGEALLTAALTSSQTLTFTYKQWQWVSSVGKIPYFDSTFALAYHWDATKKLGLDLGGKFLESDYTIGSALKTSNSCLRDDGQYTVSAGLSYAFTPHLRACLNYAYDLGRNLQELPLALAATAAYREFDRQTISLAVQYKF